MSQGGSAGVLACGFKGRLAPSGHWRRDAASTRSRGRLRYKVPVALTTTWAGPPNATTSGVDQPVASVRGVRQSSLPVCYDRTVTLARDSRWANIPVGYSDGYRRVFSNQAHVLSSGLSRCGWDRRAPGWQRQAARALFPAVIV